MKNQNRKKNLNVIKKNHYEYINSLKDKQLYEKRFRNLYKKISNLTRKVYASSNSIKCIPQISKMIFGLKEDMFRLNMPVYSFKEELNIINEYLKKAMEIRKETCYFGKCKYGETLLNLYLDLYISFTISKTEKEIESYPDFLVNPLTGSNLELDVIFQEFKLAFEFQGEHHYVENKVIEKDKFKLSKCADNKIILIPVNIFQLSNEKLSNLIVNSIKEYLGIHKNIINKTKCTAINKKILSNFYKLTQRIYLAKELFKSTLDILDIWSNEYIKRMRNKNPISSSTVAPKYIHINSDLSLKYIYKNLRFI